MSLPPILYHYFRTPLPYAPTLALQEKLHRLQATLRRQNTHQDVLLLLQHRPVYTFGRRQRVDDPLIVAEVARLERMGAEAIKTDRGGEVTYHGPGQLVGYPILDLARTNPSTRVSQYICKIQETIKLHMKERHGIQTSSNHNTGVFLDDATKIASIGVHVRHFLTSHGFSMNVTPEPMPWFNQVVACGLVGVRQGNIAEETKTMASESVTVEGEIPGLVRRFGQVFEREMVEVSGEVGSLIQAVEEEAEELQRKSPWRRSPLL
jgi:lipoyl(octanoyl) transferase 2